jgi:catechol 2,3-dioxygenase-like lactoylglutathione lyase family enzyme
VPPRRRRREAALKLTHVRLLVDDVSATVGFYRDVLGFPVTGDHGEYVELGTGEVALSAFARSEQEGTVELRSEGDAVLLVVEVESVADELERHREHVVAGPEDRPDWGLRVLYLRDPAGNLVELYENIQHVE